MSKAPKLAELVALKGFHSLLDFLKANVSKAMVPGICQNPHCDFVRDVLPDQDNGYCANCRTNTVKSGLRLAYIT